MLSCSLMASARADREYKNISLMNERCSFSKIKGNKSLLAALLSVSSWKSKTGYAFTVKWTIYFFFYQRVKLTPYIRASTSSYGFSALGLLCYDTSLHVQVIIKQEPGEVSTQQQQIVSTVTSQQQPATTAAHQFVAVKEGHMISVSAQKQAAGATTSKVSLY